MTTGFEDYDETPTPTFSLIDDSLSTNLSKSTNGETPDDFDPQQLNQFTLRLDPTQPTSIHHNRMVRNLSEIAGQQKQAAQVQMTPAQARPRPAPRPTQFQQPAGDDGWSAFAAAAQPPTYQAPPQPPMQQFPVQQDPRRVQPGYPAFPPPPGLPPTAYLPPPKPSNTIEIVWSIPSFGLIPVQVADVITNESIMIIVQPANSNSPIPSVPSGVDCAIPMQQLLYSLVASGISFEHNSYRYTIMYIQAVASMEG